MGYEMTDALKINIEQGFDGFNLMVDFVGPSGLTVLFGPSGAGKSVTLDAIAGLRAPSRGTISFGDRILYDHDNHINVPASQRRIAYVFQEARLFPHMTVLKNLNYGTRFQKNHVAQISFDQVVETLGIEDLLSRRTHNLSGGEQKRVAIGRALLSQPDLLLMDEPLANLDPPRRQEVLPLIEALRDSLRLPIIYVSHSVEEVIRLGDQMAVLMDGQIQASGPIEDVLNRSDIQPLLGDIDESRQGKAPMTILSGKVVEQDRTFGLTRIRTRNIDFWVPRLEHAIGTDTRLQIQSTDIALASEAPENTSVLNGFYAKIQELVESSSAHVDVRLETEDGERLWSRVTRKSAARLDLTKDKPIWAMVKSVAVLTGT